MRNLICTSILVLSAIVFSCKSDKKEPEILPQDKTIEKSTTMNEVSNAIATEDQVKQLFASYIQVKNSLVKTDAVAVQKAAQELEALLTNTEELKQLKATAKLISLTKGIKKQRDFFVNLTTETEKLIKKNKGIGTVYKQFCPMAFDNQGGYWLSDSNEIRNPFFGDKMLTCGMVKETIE